MRKKRNMAVLFLILLLTIFGISVSAAGISINKDSATILTGDKLQLQVIKNGRPITASWGSQNPSVATVDNNGVVTGISAGSSVITAMADGTTVECIVSVVRRSTQENARYNVLVLDTSKSMKGKPLECLKNATKRFSKAVLESDGTNYLAIVTFSNSAKVNCPFTDDISTLNKAIDQIRANGGTNLNAGMKKGGELLAGAPNGSKVMKNMIICSDGLPHTGTKKASGRYSDKDHKYYKYANAAYATDIKLKNKDYFIYALGFFHNSAGNDLKFGKQLMKDLASKDKYYVVTNTNDIDDVLENIAHNIAEITINKNEITLYVGETYNLNIKVDGVTKTASWKSNNSRIASVDSSGKVSAVKAGSTKIKGTVNGKTLTCLVTVKKREVLPTIKLNKTKATIYIKEKLQLVASVTGNSKKVSWSTSNKKIASVSSNGKVTGRKEGTVIITAKANGIKATCEVTVKIKHPEYSQYFMVKKQKSRYGSELINEYGVRLDINEDAVVKKCAVYLEKYGSIYKRTIAFVGKNVTSAKYVPYLSLNGVVKYDGVKTYNINTFNLRPNTQGVWSVSGIYELISTNLEDSSGRDIAVNTVGVEGKNTKIFYDLNKMKEWLMK